MVVTIVNDVPGPVHGQEAWIAQIAWSRRGDMLAAARYNFGSDIKIWNVATQECMHTLHYSGAGDLMGTRVCCIEWSSARDVLASGHGDGAILVWDGDTGGVLRTLAVGLPGPPLYSAVQCVAWNPVGDLVASASQDTTIKIWDSLAPGDAYVRTITGHTDDQVEFRFVAWNHEGTRLATVSFWSHNIELFKTDGEYVRTLVGHHTTVKKVKWSPTSNVLASTSADPSIRLWNTDTGVCLRMLATYGTTNALNHGDVAWNPAGTLIASTQLTGGGPGLMSVWDSHTGTLKRILTGHDTMVFRVEWNPAGNVLASGSADGTIKLWTCCVVCGLPSFQVDDHPRGGRCGECVAKLQEREVYMRVLHGGRDSRILPPEMMRMIANGVVGLPPSTTQFRFSLLCE